MGPVPAVRGRLRRLAVALLAAAAAALAVVASGAARETGATAISPSKLSVESSLSAASVDQVAKSASSRIAQTDPSLLGRGDPTPVNVFVKYDFDATASYRGGAAGLAPTSPSVTGRSLRENGAAVSAYDAYTASRAAKITSALEGAVAGVHVRDTFRTVYGGVEATVPANAVSKILSLPGVVAVQKDSLEHPTEATGVEPTFTGAAATWPALGGEDEAGDGVIVGDIDTGIWPEHPSFRDTGLSAPARTYPCQFGDGSDPALGAPFTCNDKLIGAYAFTDTYMAINGAGADEYCDSTTGVCSARDSEGHGTHTASTAVGDRVDHALLFGVDRGPISGMAPGAKLIAYRVCLALGCYDSDTVQAIQQAIADGVNVINFSVSGGNDPYTDPVEVAFLDAFNAGISVNASAGNDGPTAGTVAHNSPWVTSVGATTSDRFFTSTLHLASSDGSTLDKTGVTIMPGISTPTPVVLATGLPTADAAHPTEDVLCTYPLASGAAPGKVVACQRGVNARIDKGYNVAHGGAAGMILFNPAEMDVETDNHWLPAIHVDGPNDDLVAFVTGKAGVTATWQQGTATPTRGDVMAAFSSRGPAPDFIKPDLTAPGIQVLAGMTAGPSGITNGPSGQLFQAIAGTSMSAPHSTGASALVKAAHPDWTPAEIKSALMTSSVQDVVREDGSTAATPFDEGAGALRVNRAVNPTLVFDESYVDYVASASDPLGRIDLNIPSVDAPTMPGTVSTRRTAINVSGGDQDLSAEVSAPAGASIVVNDGRDLHVRRGGKVTFRIVISAPTLADGQYFGRITLVPRSGSTPVTIPVAFFKKQGTVSLVNSCTPTTFKRLVGHTHCTVAAQNFDAAPANVKLLVEGLSRGNALLYSNVMAPAGTSRTPLGFVWRGQLSPALAPRITGISAQSDPSQQQFGYLPLSAFGVQPLDGFGDESVANLNVPAFRYGQETYSQLLVDSNGYAVVGGGDANDNDCCNVQQFPDPSRPNNVLAPFWTDLNDTGGGVYAATLTDGTTHWIVVDWENVATFGTSDLQSFEIWIQTSQTAGENVAFDYGQVTGSGASTGFNAGAENRDGTSGVNLTSAPAAGTEYTVSTAGPTPGGSVSIDYDARAPRDGTVQSVANLASDVTPGVTQKVVTLTVTK